MSASSTAPVVLDPARPSAWLDANLRYLHAEFARIGALLEYLIDSANGGTVDEASRAVERARADVPGAPAIDFLEASFGMTRFERDLLLLTAGVEMDARLAMLCAAASIGPNSGFATFGLALSALSDGHWSALLPTRPLRRWRLLEPFGDRPLVAAPLRTDERVLHYLAGVNDLDARLRPLVRGVVPGPLIGESHKRLVAEVVTTLVNQAGPWPVIQLYGSDADGQHEVAARTAEACGRLLYTITEETVPRDPTERAAFATLWGREAAMLGAALLVDSHGAPVDATGGSVLEDLTGPVFLAGLEPRAIGRPSLGFAVEHLTAVEQRRLWQVAAGPTASVPDEDLDLLASQYRMSARAIAQIVNSTPLDPDSGDDGTLLRAAARVRRNSALGELAQGIEPMASLTDLVVPATVLDTLLEVAAQVRHRSTVYETWGLGARSSRGLGITALFAGESGTGKTMAAEALANELGLGLCRIDLSTVVSKYIGETEKNLSRVFEAAEAGGTILLFDEADALFGKRSEVKDSHDRYANIEVGYLLGRMESYRGLAILTTNIKSALDRSFQRRLRFVVQFPFPDLAQRERIWRGVFPPATPVAALDYARLARLNVAGGAIRNIAMNAAFRAAAAGKPVSMSHVIAAARGEYAKSEKQLSDGDFKDWS